VISIWDVPASRAGCKALPATLGRTPGEKTRRHNNVETPLEISPMLINRLVPRRRRSAGVQRGVASPAVALLSRFFLDWRVVAMSRSFDDSSDETQGPIDLDRLAIDSEYRRAIKVRLKLESEQPDSGGRPMPAAFTASPRKD
jgi:hypothetical protein